MNKPIAQSKGTSLNHNDKRFVEALTAKMEQLMDAKLNNFRQELQPVREQRNFPRRGREQPRQSLAKTSTQSELSSLPFEPPRKHTQAKSSNTLKEFEICYKCLSIDHCAKECPTKRKTNSAILGQKKSSASEHDSSTNDLIAFSSSLIHLSQPEGIDAGTATRGEHLDKDMAKRHELLEPEGKLIVNMDQKQSYEAALEPQRYQTEVTSTRSTFEVQSQHQNEVKGVEELSYSQGEGLTVSVPTKKNQPDICQQMPKLQIRGNYLDSQKRMKPDLVSIGTCQKVLRTIRREYDDGKPCIYQGELSLLQSESLLHPKHCKETNLFIVKPSLFVLVSAEEEKRFGLEKVKEFCVSEKDFDKMISTFKTFELETFFEPKRFMCSEFESSLRYSLSFKTSDLFKTQADFAFVRTFSKQWLENVLGVPNPFSYLGEPNLKDHVFDNRFHNLTQSNLFASKRKSLIALCSKEIFGVDHCPHALLGYDFNDTFILDHTDIICLSLSKEPNAGFHDLNRPRRTYKREEDKRFKPPDLDRPRRTYKREEDKRFKPPDLSQDKHQTISFFQLVKEAPPDTTNHLKPRLNIFGGKSLGQHNSVRINLSFVHADGSDLRTNPFQEGGDDVILRSSKGRNVDQHIKREEGKEEHLIHQTVKEQMEQEGEIEAKNVGTLQYPNHSDFRSMEPEQEPEKILVSIKEMELEQEGSKLEAEEHGAVKGVLITPRTRSLRKIIGRLLKSHGPTRSKAKHTCAHPGPLSSAIGQSDPIALFSYLWVLPIGFYQRWVFNETIGLLTQHSIVE